MHITRWGEYGILCSLYLARDYSPDSSVGAAEIAETQGIPLQYTQQILQRLRKGEIIESVRGPHGGYKLTTTPEKISLRKILYAAEGETFEIVCDANPVYEGRCDNAAHACGLKLVWTDLKVAIDELLEKENLASLLAKQLKIEAETPVHVIVPGPQAVALK
jgi:Rrf2 family protein